MSLTKATYSMIAGAVTNILDKGASTSASAADNSIAIQAAINEGGAVFIPAGTYQFDTTLTLANTTCLFGEGSSSVLEYTGVGDAIYSTDAVTGTLHKSISFLKILTSTGASGIHIVNEYHTTINNVWIWGSGTGCTSGGIVIEGTGLHNCGNISITQSVIQECASHGINFLSQNFGPGAIYIAGSRIQGNSGWGIYADQDKTVEATIIGNDIEGNAKGGIYVDYAFCLNVIGNHFEIVTAEPAIQIGGSSTTGRVYSSTISGNNCSTAGNSYCVYLNNFQNSTLSNNYFVGYGSAAVNSTGSSFNSYIQTDTYINVNNLNVTTGNLITHVSASAPSLTSNSTMSFELTSDTSLKIAVRGTDGTTRFASLTLS